MIGLRRARLPMGARGASARRRRRSRAARDWQAVGPGLGDCSTVCARAGCTRVDPRVGSAARCWYHPSRRRRSAGGWGWSRSSEAGGPLLRGVARYDPPVVWRRRWGSRSSFEMRGSSAASRPAARAPLRAGEARGIRRFEADVLVDDRPMLRFISRLGNVLHRDLRRRAEDRFYSLSPVSGIRSPGPLTRHPWRPDRSPTSRWSRSTILARATS